MTDFEHKLQCTECGSTSFLVEISVISLHCTCCECESLYSFGLIALSNDAVGEIASVTAQGDAI